MKNKEEQDIYQAQSTPFKGEVSSGKKYLKNTATMTFNGCIKNNKKKVIQ